MKNTKTTISAYSATRRGFLLQMSVIGGATLVSVSFPESSLAQELSDAEFRNWQSKSFSNYEFDDALGNYPSYAEAIGFGGGHLFAINDAVMASQFLV